MKIKPKYSIDERVILYPDYHAKVIGVRSNDSPGKKIFYYDIKIIGKKPAGILPVYYAVTEDVLMKNKSTMNAYRTKGQKLGRRVIAKSKMRNTKK